MTHPRTLPIYALRILLFLAIGSIGTWGVLTSYPVRMLTYEQMNIVGAFRVIYGLFFAFRLFRSLPGISLVLGWERSGLASVLYWIGIFNCLFIAAGLLTPFALSFHWALLVFIQKHHRVYSVEDVLNRLPGVCLLFMNSHLNLSLDSWLGWNYGLVSGGTLGVNFFIWTFCVVMFSTGYEKLWSPAWRKGLGFYHFVSIPFIARPIFRQLRRFKLLCLVASWSSLILELGLIFSTLESHIFIVALIFLVGFGICLTFGPAPFFFVGGATTWGGAFILAMVLTRADLPTDNPGIGAVILLILYWVGCFAVMGFSKIRGGWAAWLMEKTIYLRPYILFNEVHFYGLYIFRITAQTPKGRIDPLRLFTESGEPGPMQELRPVAMYASFTRVTDYCIACIHNQSDRLDFFGRVQADLGWMALNRLPKEFRKEPVDLRFEIKVYDPPAEYDIQTNPWRTDWVEIGYYEVDNATIRFVQKGEIPHYGKTVRWPVLWK
ncbi:MAG: hypothetical protein V4599_13860 [Verrucomicrobiota bacterium]